MLRRADRDFSATAEASDQVSDSVVHVRYEDLVSDPVATVKRVYSNFGWSFTSAYEQKLVAYIAKNKSERKAKGVSHSYSLEQFGLSREAVAAEVSWYTEKYLGSK